MAKVSIKSHDWFVFQSIMIKVIQDTFLPELKQRKYLIVIYH